ncbi:MAG: DMT family transporter [Pseudomonadales bacterium]
MGISAHSRGALSFAAAMLISASIGLVVSQLTLGAIEIVFFRCAIGAICLLAYVLLFERRGWCLDPSELRYTLIAAVFLVFNWVFLFSAFKATSITVAVSIYYLAPIFITLYGMLVLKEGTSAMKIATIALAFAGALLVSGLADRQALALSVSGALYALLAALLYAGLVILAKNIKRAKPAHTALLQTVTGTLILLLFIDLSWQQLLTLNWSALLLIGAVHTAAMYILFFYGVANSPVSLVALLGFIDPMIAVLLDFTLLDASLSWQQWLGAGLIFAAISLKVAQEQRRDNAAYATNS